MLPVVGAYDNTGNAERKVSLIPCVLKKKSIKSQFICWMRDHGNAWLGWDQDGRGSHLQGSHGILEIMKTN